MSHSDAQTRTMHGYERRPESSPAAIEEGREVKRLPWAAGLPAEMLALFTRDATTVAGLRHPHVAQVHAAGRLPDGTPYIVMERLRGRTLEQAMQVGPVPVADLAPILRGIASALSAAHAAGVVHGGLRADAVFLAEMPGYRWGFAKLLDFGIARLGAAGEADARADQRALVELASRALGRPFPPAAQRVLERATSWDAQLPFASVTSFMEALEEALAIASVDSAPAAAAAPVATSAPLAAAAPVAAVAPAVANPPSSLTQQFFAEGERQDVVHAAEDDDLEPDGPDVSVARVPRNRAQIVMTTALAFGAVAIIVGTLVSLSSARDPSPAAAVVVQRPSDVPVSTQRAPMETRAGAARTSGESRPAQRERSHQGRTAAHRPRLAEPPRFVPAPVPPAVAAAPVTLPAPAAGPPVPAPAAPAPAPSPPAPEVPAPTASAPSASEASAPAAVAAPPEPAAETAPTSTTTAPEDTSVVTEDDASQSETE